MRDAAESNTANAAKATASLLALLPLVLHAIALLPILVLVLGLITAGCGPP